MGNGLFILMLIGCVAAVLIYVPTVEDPEDLYRRLCNNIETIETRRIPELPLYRSGLTVVAPDLSCRNLLECRGHCTYFVGMKGDRSDTLPLPKDSFQPRGDVYDRLWAPRKAI